MTGAVATRRSSSLVGVALVSSMLVAGLFAARPASAHNFTRSDGDDARGLLDLRSAGVSHTSTAVVHSFRTFAGWAPSDLGRQSSLFVIGIDKNNDPRDAERCVLVFFARRLRALLTGAGCGRGIGQIPVSKPNRTTVKVKIPESQTGLSYGWAVISAYFEKKPCLNGCFDGIPNTSTFILHDLIPPRVSMQTSTLRVWDADDDATFSFPFSISDSGGSGVDTWRIQRRQAGSSVWRNVISGSGGGSKNPSIIGSPGRFVYRVLATDKHGNKDVGPSRRVYIPIDDRDVAPDGAFLPAPALVDEPTAWEGTLSRMDAGGGAATFTYTWTPGADCLFELIGPGTGPWDITVAPLGGTSKTITDADVADQPRQTVYSDATCAIEYAVTVNSGVFDLDAVLG